MKFYSEESFSENNFCCLLQNSKLPPGIIDSKWEGLSEFITSTGAAEKSSLHKKSTIFYLTQGRSLSYCKQHQHTLFSGYIFVVKLEFKS